MSTTRSHIRQRPYSWTRSFMVWQLSLSVLVSPFILTGCAASRNQWKKTVHNDTCEVDYITRQIDNPAPPVFNQVSMTSEPVTALTLAESDISYVDMSLNSVLQMAMEHSSVLRDIGGIVLRSPDTVNTGFSTRLQETDPRFGMEAALSAFDAQLAASANFNSNNRVFNNSFFAGGATAFEQDLHNYQMELSKRTAAGSLLAIRGVTGYDDNNAPANTFRSSWDTWLEGEIRQPLLQGGGAEFNRIAGPGATPGVYNGVVIAKANSDINHAEFMTSLRGFVSNVENAYWDLYGAYRELDARKKAMEKSLVAWNETKAKTTAGSFEAADEALARQQYYQLKAEVDEALSGRLLQGTQTQNGSGGGTVQMTGGVLAAERRLRLLTGMTAADGQLIRTLDEPSMAQIHFDWDSCMNEAIQQRPELQRQHIVVKKKELELLAARNFLNPRLDAVGRYRWRGFGDDLIANGNQSGTAPASALGNLATGDQQEWTLGVELTIPIGYRKAHAAVQNGEIALSRARVIQKEQQREVISGLNGAIADAVRAYQAVENNLNQYLGAKDYLEALEARKLNGQNDSTDRILDAQRRLVQAEIQFFRARAEYAVTLKNVHYEKGSLLRYKDLRVADASTNEYSETWGEVVPQVPPEPLSTATEANESSPKAGSPDSGLPKEAAVASAPVASAPVASAPVALKPKATMTATVSTQNPSPATEAAFNVLAPMMESGRQSSGFVSLSKNQTAATNVLQVPIAPKATADSANLSTISNAAVSSQTLAAQPKKAEKRSFANGWKSTTSTQNQDVPATAGTARSSTKVTTTSGVNSTGNSKQVRPVSNTSPTATISNDRRLPAPKP